MNSSQETAYDSELSISLHNAVPVCIVRRAEMCISPGVYAVNAQARFLAELFIVGLYLLQCRRSNFGSAILSTRHFGYRRLYFYPIIL